MIEDNYEYAKHLHMIFLNFIYISEIEKSYDRNV